MNTRWLIGAVAATMSVAGGAIAIAAAGQSDSASLPEGPDIAFCPTPDQIEAHFEKYGFDYKPTVSCTRDGAPAPPTAEQKADTAADPDEGLTDAESCEAGKNLLKSATPAPDSDDDPSTVEGLLPDGRMVKVISFGKPDLPKGWSIRDEASVYRC